MEPIGPLMIEHRLIERMLDAIRIAAALARERGAIDPADVDVVVDFMRTYADRMHHGKEEDILFRDFRSKAHSAEDDQVLRDLVADHVRGRTIVGRIAEANKAYRAGSAVALDALVVALSEVLELYPEHIRREDTAFFPAAMRYFDKAERHAMLDEMREFDRKMFHERYAAAVKELAGRLGEAGAPAGARKGKS